MSQNAQTGYQSLDAFDVSDENPEVIARQIRDLTREIRAGFEMLAQEIKTLRKLYESTEDRVADLEQRGEPRRKAIKK
jgi:hypothetical protein